VLAQVDTTDVGNKQKLSEKQADVLSTRQKWQLNEGRFQAFKCFNDNKEEKLTRAELLFHDGKVDLYSNNPNGMENACHLGKELASTK
jgi:hypothetical protein